MGEFRQFRDVTLEETCPQCQGSGVVVSPKWEAWEEEYGELFKQMLRRNDEDGLEKLEATMPDEPEEIACPQMWGLGKIPTPQGEALLATELQRAVERVKWAHSRWLELEDDHSYISWVAAKAWLDSVIQRAKGMDKP